MLTAAELVAPAGIEPARPGFQSGAQPTELGCVLARLCRASRLVALLDPGGIEAIERTLCWALVLLMARITHDPATGRNAGSNRGVCGRGQHWNTQ